MAFTSEERLEDLADANIPAENTSTDRTPEDLLAEDAGEFDEAQELNISTDDLAAAEDRASMSDANDDADAREEQIETDNDTIDTLVADSQEVSDEGIDDASHTRD